MPFILIFTNSAQTALAEDANTQVGVEVVALVTTNGVATQTISHTPP